MYWKQKFSKIQGIFLREFGIEENQVFWLLIWSNVSKYN